MNPSLPPFPKSPSWDTEKTSRLAVTSFILGLLSFCLPVVLSLAAMICAVLSLWKIRKSYGCLGGRGFAVLGLFLGVLSLVVAGVVGQLFIQPMMQRQQVTNDLKQIGTALLDHEKTTGFFPEAALFDTDKKPLLSWRVALLPYLGEEELHKQFHLDEPWDSKHNLQLLVRMPRVYAHPASSRNEAREGKTHYLAPCVNFRDQQFTGTGVISGAVGSRVGTRHITDGVARTILIIETTKAVPWTKPEDAEFGMGAQTTAAEFRGLLGEGFFALFADGRVLFIDTRKILLPNIWGALTRSGGEIISLDPNQQQLQPW